MPVYEFVCLGCEARFDKLLPMAAADPACPSCGATRVRRQLSVIAGLSGGGAGSPGASGCACGGACACGR
jgi:putative FmdB family regulatory protein